MYRKLIVTVLTLTTSLLWAQSMPTSDNTIRARLHGSDYDGEISQPAPAQAANQSNPVSAQLTMLYKFTSLQFPNAFNTLAFGINNQGQIVGTYRVLPGPRHALLVDNGKLNPLDPSILGQHFSSAFDINERGDIVGSYVDDQFVQHGFLLSNNATHQYRLPLRLRNRCARDQ